MQAQAENLSPGDHALTFKSTEDGTSQPYRLFLPEIYNESESLPLVVVLHGKFVDQNAWFDYTPIKEFAEKEGYIALAPYGRGDYFYQGPGEQDVLDLIDIAKREYKVDPDRVYLMGHSMGGWGTWWIGLRHPDLFATISPMAGFAPLDLLPNARNLAPFIIHDSTDPIVSVEHSRQADAELKRLGIEHHYREEKGYGHSSQMIGDNLGRLFEWMSQHRRVKQPEKFTLVTSSPAAGKAYGYSILETLEFPHNASIDVDASNPEKIQIKTNRVATLAIDLSALPETSAKSRSLQIDGDVIPITEKSGWIKLSLQKGKWDSQPLTALPKYKSPVLGQVRSVINRKEKPEYLLHHMGEWLLEVIDADVVLFTDDMFIEQLPAGQLTADQILYLYLYSERRLGRFTCSGEEFQKILQTEAPQGKEWWGNLRAVGKKVEANSKQYQVVAPLHVARTFVEKPEVLPDLLPVYLYQAIKKNAPVKLGKE